MLTQFDNKNLRSTLYQAMALAESGSWSDLIALPTPSDQQVQQYAHLGALPEMREHIGGRQSKRFNEFIFSITNKPFELTIEEKIEQVKWDKTGQFDRRISEIGFGPILHKEKLISDLVIGGETGICYDGQFFFDTDHVIGSSGTINNDLTASEVAALDVTATGAMTGTEAANVINGLIAKMLGFVNDQGTPINQSAKSFAVMAALGHKPGIDSALGNQFLTNGVSNPLAAAGYNIVPIYNPRITTATKIYVFRTDAIIKPLILQTAFEPTIRAYGEDSHHCFETRMIQVGVDWVGNAGYGRFEHAVLGTLS